MAQARDQAGNLWDVTDPNNPVLIQAAQAQGPVTIGTPDPTYPYQEPKARIDIEDKASSIQSRDRGDNRADDQFAADLYSKGLRMVNGQVEPIPNWTPPNEIKTPEQIEKDKINATSSLDNLLTVIREARALAQQGTTGMGSLASYIPGTKATDLSGAIDTLQANLSFDRLQEMRDASKTGGALGAVSEKELALLGSTVASLKQDQSASQFLANLDRIEKHYKRFGLAIAGMDPDSDEGKKAIAQVDKTNRFIDTKDRGDAYEIGVKENFQTDQDKKFGALAQAAFDRGASAEDMRKLAADYGYGAYGPDLEQAIQYRDTGGVGARITAPSSGYLDPGIVERARQNIGASPVGQYFGGAANALSLGFMDEIQGGAKTLTQGGDLTENIAEADLVKSLGAGASPKANLLGNVSGGILGALATGGVAGVGSGAVGTFAPRALAGDAMFGAGFGAGESNDDRLAGAGLGAVAGVGGGALGRSAGRRLGGIIGGSSNKAARELRNRGVTLTPGMIGGGSAMQKESRKAGLPGADFPIKQAQERSYDQWNRAVFNEGMDPIGVPISEIGETGVEEARDAVRKGYSFLDNVGLQEDQQIINALGGRINQARSIPGLGDQTEYSLQKSIDGFFDPETGTLTGRNFQNINQNLTRRAGNLEKSPEAVGPDAADVLRGARDDFGDLAGRQAPEIMPQFRNANQAYGNYKTIQEAVSKGKNTGGRFTPAQLGMAAEQSARKYGGKHGTTERPFFELQRYGQEVLPNTVPDSGTAGRAMTDGVINTGRNALRGITNKALYSEPVLELMNRAAFDRPEALIALGEAMKRRSRLGGLIGAPAFLPAVD